MNKRLRYLVLGLLTLLPIVGFESDVRAAPNDLCGDPGSVFVFFNGVQTTPDEADVALQEFQRLYGKADTGGPIRYERLYNYSNGFEDFVETFEQRLLEQDGLLAGRFELFFEALNGDGPWWNQITDTVSSTAGILSGFVDWYQAQVVQKLTTLFANPPTEVNYQEHRVRLDNILLEGRKLLLVAHSQGNLFANAAYTHALTKVDAASVKLVHIAPASPIVNGPHTLADLDLVINGLRLAGSVPPVTDNIPGYLLRPPGVNGKRDILGHGLLEIYLNQQLNVSQRITTHVQDALRTLKAPPATASQGFFTVTLTWDGSGDVDLHTFEPNGAHVWYSSKVGPSGYLDVDNTVANGPEHYYASCDSTKLKPGTYPIEVANYRAATGRTATVQIASWVDGVLGTKSTLLGAVTGNTPSTTLFNVIVAQDSVSKKFSVSLGQ